MTLFQSCSCYQDELNCAFHGFISDCYRWFRQHEYIEKLNMQAILNASAVHDEYVKDLLVSYGKVSTVLPSSHQCRPTVNVMSPWPLQIPVLVHEMILIEVWKQSVFPILCQLRDFKPKNTFQLYMVVRSQSHVKLGSVHSSTCFIDSPRLLDPPRSHSHKPPGDNHVSQGRLTSLCAGIFQQELQNLTFCVFVGLLWGSWWLCRRPGGLLPPQTHPVG